MTTDPYYTKKLRRFTRLMRERLEANDDKDGWDDCDFEYLIRRLREETKELVKELRSLPLDWGRQTVSVKMAKRIHHEAADVANFAFMIADLVTASKK
jgi:NTP pyrophosphatase (non-canonical NTP hydrolase)